MISALQKREDGSIKLAVTIPNKDVVTMRQTVIDEYVKQTTLPGFRKGKAPTKLVEEKLDPEKIKEEVLRKLLPKFYIQAVTEYKINPILTPRIHIEPSSFEKEENDWQFTAITCEAPTVQLENYKEEIKKINAKSKIVIPGKEQQLPTLDDVIKLLLDSVSVTIPKTLIDHEVDRLLSQTLDEIKKLGLSLDQYLSSTGKTAESLRFEYEQKAQGDIKLEFALQKIAEEEKITVKEKEIDEAIQKTKDETERKNMEVNRYLLASILRQQKILDFLKNL